MKNCSNMSLRTFKRLTENKEVILTDFFDTLVFRRIHSSQIYRQWAKALIHRLGLEEEIEVEEVVSSRHNAKTKLRRTYKEPPYAMVAGEIYDCFSKKARLSRTEFCNICLETDKDVELGCQYGNTHLIKLLRSAKENGKKIYVVSDFYLPPETYRDFLINAGCEDVVDGVFVSESCGKTKANGSLYSYVLKELEAQPEQCVMIGDSKSSDVVMARKHGIAGVWYFPLRHKIWTNISRVLKLNYGDSIQAALSSHLYKTSLFDEYAIVLYHFAHELVKTASRDGAHNLAFVSRGGYFLKQVVDEYLHYAPRHNMSTAYCYASRKVCLTVNAEEQKTLKEYLDGFKDGERLVMVDEGWYCHSQQRISELFKIPTTGYYLGVRGKDAGYENCTRKGLLFDKYGNEGKPSMYYGIFCTNCSMYEQMLTSNEGSVIGYTKENEKIAPVLKVNQKEKSLYDEVISKWQRKMLLVIRGLCAWKLSDALSERALAKMVLRTSLFASHWRCDLQNKLDSSMIDNFSQAKQRHKTAKDAHVNILDLIKRPDMYLGMVCKVQRIIHRHFLYNCLYKVFAFCFYWYVRFLKGLW